MVALGAFARTRWQSSPLGRFRGLGDLTGSTLLSETADQFAQVALIWVVLTVSHSPADAGLVVLFRRIPEIVSGPLVGSRFDRWPPVLLTNIGFLARGAGIAVIAVLSLLGSLDMTVVFVICFLMGVTNPLAKVGARVILPRLVPAGQLHVANGVLTIGDQFPYLVGPALGGALAGFLGAPALLVPAGMCLAATVMLARVKVGPLAPAVGSVPAAPRRPGRDGWFGFRPLLTIPVVRGMMLLTLIYYISYGPLLTAVPVYAGDRLHTGGAGYGAMWSVMGVGALAGLVAIPRLARLRPAVVNAVGVVLWGVVLLPLVVVTSLPVALVIMFVGGVVWAPYAATEISVLQSWVPGDQLGAVFGARRSVIVASSPSGAALGGLLLERMSSITVIGLSAGACVVGGLACLALPAVRRTPAIGAETAPDEPAAEPVA